MYVNLTLTIKATFRSQWHGGPGQGADRLPDAGQCHRIEPGRKPLHRWHERPRPRKALRSHQFHLVGFFMNFLKFYWCFLSLKKLVGSLPIWSFNLSFEIYIQVSNTEEALQRLHQGAEPQWYICRSHDAFDERSEKQWCLCRVG